MARALTSRAVVTKVLDNVYESNQCAQPFYLWWQDAPLLGLDHAELAFLDEVKNSLPLEKDCISDIVFLSRHSAATGKPSLTVHPIGVPGTVDTDYMGGISGRASPPSFRIGALYRLLLASTKDSRLEGEFEVTLEATHHGPHTDLPACFVEIGSTEAEWGRADAGELWADVLSAHYGGSGAFRDAATTAVVLIGGGHYCPKMGDVARMGEQVAVGHILAQVSE
jgi:D-aminoacyl-tRNA deacylase